MNCAIAMPFLAGREHGATSCKLVCQNKCKNTYAIHAGSTSWIHKVQRRVASNKRTQNGNAKTSTTTPTDNSNQDTIQITRVCTSENASTPKTHNTGPMHAQKCNPTQHNYQKNQHHTFARCKSCIYKALGTTQCTKQCTGQGTTQDTAQDTAKNTAQCTTQGTAQCTTQGTTHGQAQGQTQGTTQKPKKSMNTTLPYTISIGFCKEICAKHQIIENTGLSVTRASLYGTFWF